MNGVIGLNELLLTTELDDRAAAVRRGRARPPGDALLDVINEILDFSKIESGHLELEKIDFDLVQLVEGVAELVGEPAAGQGARAAGLLLAGAARPRCAATRPGSGRCCSTWPATR